MQKRILVLFLSLGLLASGAFAEPTLEGPTLEGHWQGAIEVPSSPLEINLDFALGADGTWTGDISIPVQGLQDFALTNIVVDGAKAKFEIPDIPGGPAFDGELSADGERLSGTFTQGGGSLDFTLGRDGKAADKARAALEGFDEFVEQALKDWNVPGAGIAVVVDDEVVYAKGFGYRDVEEKLPMTADTLFAIGSTSKAFTTTLMGMLSDEGKFEWDEPLRNYLPTFRLQDEVVAQRLTPRDLVTHRSGLPRHDLLWYNNNEVSRADLVAKLAHLEATEDLRQRFQYNNLMYLTAGYLTEQLTGQTWEQLVGQRILEPLGMERTTFNVHDSQKDDDFAQPHRENDDGQLEKIPFRDISLVGPAGSINSSVSEMSHWLRFNLRGGSVADGSVAGRSVGGRQLIEKATLTDIHAPHMALAATPQRVEIQPVGYALGWGVGVYRGHRRVSHGGGIDGFVTAVALYPEDQMGVVAFTNSASGLPDILRNHAVDRVLGLKTIDWNAEALEEVAKAKQGQEEGEANKDKARRQGTKPSHDLADYAADYHHPGYGALAVTLGGERLAVRFNGIDTPLEHWHFDVFNGAPDEAADPTFKDVRFHFRGDLDGSIASVEAQFEPAVAPIVFTRQADSSMTDAAFLERLVGQYQLTGQVAEIKLVGGKLTATLPGQPVFTLEPHLEGRFRLKEFHAITVGFDLPAAGSATKVTFFQPNGVFEGTRVTE